MSWFSRRPKTIEVETRNEDGTVTKRRVPEAAFHSAIDKLVAAGKAEVLDACIAHILEVGWGEYKANWVVDDDIPRATYDRFVTGGHVYVSIHYEEGLPKTRVLKKELWEVLRSRLAEVDAKIDAKYAPYKSLLPDEKTQRMIEAQMYDESSYK